MNARCLARISGISHDRFVSEALAAIALRRSPPGGAMPSHHLKLTRQHADLFEVENEWRWFFPATAGLFGYAEGSEWGDYRMKAAG